jgi:hypothetical protein
MLQKQSVSVIYSEVLFNRQYDEQAYYHEIAAWLAQFGYRLFRFYGLRYAPDRSLSYTDAIFCTGAIHGAERLRSER